MLRRRGGPKTCRDGEAKAVVSLQEPTMCAGTCRATEPIYVYAASDADTVLLVGDTPAAKSAYWWATRASPSRCNRTPTWMRSSWRPSTGLSRLGRWRWATWPPQVSRRHITGTDYTSTADIVVRCVPHSGVLRQRRDGSVRRAEVLQRADSIGGATRRTQTDSV